MVRYRIEYTSAKEMKNERNAAIHNPEETKWEDLPKEMSLKVLEYVDKDTVVSKLGPVSKRLFRLSCLAAANVIHVKGNTAAATNQETNDDGEFKDNIRNLICAKEITDSVTNLILDGAKDEEPEKRYNIQRLLAHKKLCKITNGISLIYYTRVATEEEKKSLKKFFHAFSNLNTFIPFVHVFYLFHIPHDNFIFIYVQ